MYQRATTCEASVGRMQMSVFEEVCKQDQLSADEVLKDLSSFISKVSFHLLVPPVNSVK